MNVSEQHEPDSDNNGAAHPEGSRRTIRSPLWWVVGVGLLLFLYLSFSFVDVWLASRTEFDPVLAGDTRRAAVVLGAAQYNGEPSPVLRARLDEAAELYESGVVELVVVTGGGQPTDVTTEAKTGYDYLRETSGIPDDQLRLEVQGGSTYESLAASARFLRIEGVVDVILVTDRFHVKRSTLIAEEVGLRPVAAPTPQAPSLERLVQESVGVSIGRVIGFRRLDRF